MDGLPDGYETQPARCDAMLRAVGYGRRDGATLRDEGRVAMAMAQKKCITRVSYHLSPHAFPFHSTYLPPNAPSRTSDIGGAASQGPDRALES